MSLSDNFIYDFENALFDYNWNYVVSPSSKSKEELAFCILLIFWKIIKFYSAYIFWKKSLYFEVLATFDLSLSRTKIGRPI